MKQMPFQNFLSIRWDGKAVPYGGHGEPREDGSANFGFKNLKGNCGLVASVPELAQDSALKSIVTAIAAPECGLFTVKCDSGEVSEQRGFRMSGYLEVAINSRKLVDDAGSYFPLFFHFDKYLHKTRFSSRVQLNWELQPATLLDAHVDGFTCSITVNTHFHESMAEAIACWRDTFAAMQYCFERYPNQDDTRVY